MVPVSDFVPTLRLLVDVPVPGLMETTIVKAAQRFCRESKLLVKTRQFDEVFEYKSVSVISLQTGTRGKAQLKGAGLVNVTSQGQPLKAGYDFVVASRDDITFKADFSDVVITAIAEPIINADQLPDVLLHDYVDGICAGAANLLQLQPTTSWFNPDLAQYNQREFISAIRQAYRYAIEHTPALELTDSVCRREFF
ncbi:hypothetical protein CTM97_19330 [Photobacterium phosphoreum]|uniref:Uncharacterized protein n=1 Tax=Photobacterium phosphoreum TaxID=659 RepID=A0A2T3JQ09_PHOPO|nr:hypothetical protein [Photobacterium phosphoreum]PSU24684.1 hypothetical protein CTM96_12145 [Photobacterium phosphoreum]PSU38244.1 hypothetical protein CTM97_19330 [Photobacterium phosphoreum]PSU51142.1 hypothetical protein C9J18_13185 [Photobacterium phosphoreum]